MSHLLGLIIIALLFLQIGVCVVALRVKEASWLGRISFRAMYVLQGIVCVLAIINWFLASS